MVINWLRLIYTDDFKSGIHNLIKVIINVFHTNKVPWFIFKQNLSFNCSYMF